VGRLHEAMATDPEFAQALIGRNERRRTTVNVLIGRIAGKTALPRARRDAVDLIFALTSFAMFAMLRADRSVDEVCALVKSACHGALGPLLSDASRSGSRPRRPGASRAG
jgi:predicted transcriptional regulator